MSSPISCEGDMIELSRLKKRFGGVVAVDELTLSIPRGEFFGFLGPNGAGKTTTIKLMAGLLKPTAGRVCIGSFDVVQEPLRAKQIVGFIPDRSFLYEKLTGREFLAFIAEVYGLEPKSYKPMIASLLEEFELTPWGDELIESYSHGMRQRLVICSALIHHPRVILVDEPMVALDPKGVKLVKELFTRLCQQGVTIFMSTHTLSLAEELCHRIGIIHRGRLVAVGTREELRRRASIPQTGLEDIFLELTREDESVNSTGKDTGVNPQA
ncbi:MAG: ABC transporter ATP-binding protein [Acidobacteriota bacterium]